MSPVVSGTVETAPNQISKMVFWNVVNEVNGVGSKGRTFNITEARKI